MLTLIDIEKERRRRHREYLQDSKSRMEYYQTHPKEWMKDRLGIRPETIDWELLSEYENHVWDGTRNPLKQILDALVKWEWVGVESATACSKTFLAAAIALWFLENFENSIVVTSAPKSHQLELHIWKEIGKLHKKFNRGYLDSLALRMVKSDQGKKEYGWSIVGFVAGTKADKEVEDKAAGFHCLSDDHEILTKRGWLKKDEITTNDKVLSCPLNGEIAEWMPVDEVMIYRFDGFLNEYNGRYVDFCVTDNHKLPSKYNERINKWKFQKLKDIKQQFYLRRISKWKGDVFEIPIEFRKIGFDEKRFAEFLGFWIGDGGLKYDKKRNKDYHVILYQKKNDNGYTLKLLEGLDIYKIKDGYVFYDQDVAKWLANNVGRYGNERIIPRIILDAHPNILECFLNGFWKAEGNYTKEGLKRCAYNTSREVIDGLQEILIKLGRPTTIGVNTKAGDIKHYNGINFKARHDCYSLSYVKRATNHIVKTKDIRKIEYHGDVWCINTPYHTFYTRRNGKVFLSGNSEHMLIILEETPGIPRSIINTFKLTSQAPHNLILALGNPNHHLDNLHQFCKHPRARHIRISGLDYPNIVLKNPSFIPGGKSEQGIQDILDDVRSVEAPRYLSRVRGISPQQSSDSLINVKWCYDAVERDDEEVEKGLFALGVDVADSETGDEAAKAFGKGAVLIKVDAFKCPDANQLGKKDVYQDIFDYKIDPKRVGVDGVGVGAGTINALKEMGFVVANLKGGASPVPVPKSAYTFKNLRSQMWWEIREDLRLGTICIPNDEELIADLCAPTYKVNDKEIVIESKDDIKKRLGRSPNKGDSAVYWNWVRKDRYKTKVKARVIS